MSEPTTFFKATRTDGTDFHTGTIDYAAACGTGELITLPEVEDPQCCTDAVLHASTVPTETLYGGWWPCRLFEVTGTPVAEEGHKRGFFSLAVVREVDAHLIFGPQSEQVTALIDRATRLDRQDAESLVTAWEGVWPATWNAASDVARRAAIYAARRAASYAAGDAARRAVGYTSLIAARYISMGAARALVARDLIGETFTQEHYDLLTRPWQAVIGKLHPDDPDLRAGGDPHDDI